MRRDGSFRFTADSLYTRLPVGYPGYTVLTILFRSPPPSDGSVIFCCRCRSSDMTVDSLSLSEHSAHYEPV